MKIIVDSEQEKAELLEAIEYIHYLRCVDTDHSPMVNRLVHMYLAPELIEVINKDIVV